MVKKKYIIAGAGIVIGVVVLIGVILAVVLTKSSEEGNSPGKNKTSKRDKIANLRQLIYVGLEKDETLRNLLSTDLALKVKLSEVQFYLYTQKNKDEPFIILMSDVNTLRSSNFNPSNKILIICHGWRNNATSEVNTLIKDAVLEKHDMNVFVTDWGIRASRAYVISKNSVEAIGKIVGKFLNQIQIVYGLGGDSFILTGHSLGAHIIGNAGAILQQKASYVVGMDPAGPLFNLTARSGRLDPSDGEHVQVIHTNAAMLGLDIPSGHADYYPNGGMRQPGCGLDTSGTCAHTRSYEYFAESIRRGPVFLATRCHDYKEFTNKLCLKNPTSYMGQLEPDTEASGDYYLDTNPKPPYGLTKG